MQVPYHQKHSFQGGINPATGRMLDGAERIAQHFRYAINHIFTDAFPKAPAVIIAEDDFLFASDWYEYFHAVAPALESDPTLWLASAWVSAEGGGVGAARWTMCGSEFCEHASLPLTAAERQRV